MHLRSHSLVHGMRAPCFFQIKTGKCWSFPSWTVAPSFALGSASAENASSTLPIVPWCHYSATSTYPWGRCCLHPYTFCTCSYNLINHLLILTWMAVGCLYTCPCLLCPVVHTLIPTHTSPPTPQTPTPHTPTPHSHIPHTYPHTHSYILHTPPHPTSIHTHTHPPTPHIPTLTPTRAPTPTPHTQ